MNNNILINLLINTKNKKCKMCAINMQKHVYFYKILQKHVKIYTHDKLLSLFKNKKPNIFAEYEYYNQRDMLEEVATKVCDKLNSNTAKYRGVKSDTIIESVAENVASEISAKSGVDIIKFISKTYNFDNFYKKELTILPTLIAAKITQKIANILLKLNSIDKAIKCGSKYSTFVPDKNYSNGELYGIIKFNKNLLKFSEIPNSVFYHSVFSLIRLIEDYQCQLRRLIDAIIYLNNKFNL